jgi:DNA-binding protein HU-beta
MSNLDNALRELREKRSHAQLEIEKLDQIIAGIESLSGAGAAVPTKGTKAKHTLSASARRRISLAQKARWAKVRGGSKPTLVAKTAAAPAKRTMSASARRKIAAAQKKRWAVLRKESQPVLVATKPTGSAPAKRKISAAGRKRIAAAQKARWAKIKAAKKAA